MVYLRAFKWFGRDLLRWSRGGAFGEVMDVGRFNDAYDFLGST